MAKISPFKRQRIIELYKKEPDLDIFVFEERFDVGRITLRAIFKSVDRSVFHEKYKKGNLALKKRGDRG